MRFKERSPSCTPVVSTTSASGSITSEHAGTIPLKVDSLAEIQSGTLMGWECIPDILQRHRQIQLVSQLIVFLHTIVLALKKPLRTKVWTLFVNAFVLLQKHQTVGEPVKSA